MPLESTLKLSHIGEESFVINPKSARFNRGIYARRIGSDLVFSSLLTSSDRVKTSQIQSFERRQVKHLMGRIKDSMRGGSSEFMKTQSTKTEDDSILKLLR